MMFAPPKSKSRSSSISRNSKIPVTTAKKPSATTCSSISISRNSKIPVTMAKKPSATTCSSISISRNSKIPVKKPSTCSSISRNSKIPARKPSAMTCSSISTNSKIPAAKKPSAIFDRGGNMDKDPLTESFKGGSAQNNGSVSGFNLDSITKFIRQLDNKLASALNFDSVTEGIDQLGNQFVDYQYNMQRHVEHLKKALGVERQCVLDLEKALQEMRSEHSEIKYNADSKLVEANLLVINVEKKSAEVEAKIHAADAKLAEVNRKSLEIERKMHEIEDQENALRRERTFFNIERKTHESSISKQKEDLRVWERKLQEAEERLADGRRLLYHREEKANDSDKILKDKQTDLGEFQKKIEMNNLTLKNKGDDMSHRLANVALKEKEVDGLKKNLEAKEKPLLEFEETLNAIDKMETRKLVDEHGRIPSDKKKEFELDMEEKKKLRDEQLKEKIAEVEKREAEIAYVEEKMKKRERAIEKKLEKVKEKEVGYNPKSKALKEREKFAKAKEKRLVNEKKQLLADKEEILGLTADLEKLKADAEREQLRINEEIEQLKLTKEERTELELKQEIDNYSCTSELLVKETDDLKQEWLKFEKEWEEIDEKRAEIKKDQEPILDQRKHLEKFRQTEEERLQKEKLETEEHLHTELEALKLAKDSFAVSMEQEKLMLAQYFQNERSLLLHVFELLKQEMETEMQKKHDEMEARLSVREKSFLEEKERELNNINYLRDVARRESEEMKLERQGIEKEKVEISEIKKHVESQRFELKNDSEELVSLYQKLKDQREQFIKERKLFIALADKQKDCNACGEIICEFMLSNLNAVNNLEAPPLPRVTENYINQAIVNDETAPVVFDIGSPTVKTISWLRKCTTKMLKHSPGLKLELKSGLDQAETSMKKPDVSLRENKPDATVQVANNDSNGQIIESESGIREVEAVQIPENSGNSNLGKRRGGRRGVGGPSALRTRAVKNAVTVSKTGLEEQSNQNLVAYANGNATSSAHLHEESITDSGAVGAPKMRRKRNLIDASKAATVSENQSEGQSESSKDSDRPKRRQGVAAAEPSVVQKRYNLRTAKKPTESVTGSLGPENSKKAEEDGNPSGFGEEASTNEIEEFAERAGIGDKYGERHGAAFELAGVVKEFRITCLKTHNVRKTLQDGLLDRNSAKSREVALLVFKCFCEKLGRLFELYVIQMLPLLLSSFSDQVVAVIEAAECAARAMMSQLSAKGLKLVFPSLLKVVNSVPKDVLPSYMKLVRDAISTSKDKECRKKKGGPVLIPGFCLLKALQPILPMFLQGVLLLRPSLGLGNVPQRCLNIH